LNVNRAYSSHFNHASLDCRFNSASPCTTRENRNFSSTRSPIAMDSAKDALKDAAKFLAGDVPVLPSAGQEKGIGSAGFRSGDRVEKPQFLQGSVPGVGVSAKEASSDPNVPSKYVGETIGGDKAADSGIAGSRVKPGVPIDSVNTITPQMGGGRAAAGSGSGSSGSGSS